MRSAGPTRTFVYAAIVGTVLGLFVSTAATLLAPRIARNIELERQHNVLIATGLVPPSTRASARSTGPLFERHVVEEMIASGTTLLPVYRALDERGATIAHCLPIEGPGLWGTIRGFLAVDDTATRIVGVTFYEHSETPGLGAQVASSRWTAQWRDKSIVTEDGELIGIDIVKGKVDPDNEWQLEHAVDGISGATITGNAVEALTRDSLERYLPYLEALWQDR